MYSDPDSDGALSTSAETKLNVGALSSQRP